MKKLAPAVGLELLWVQPTMFMRHFELYAEGSLVGELRFENAATAHGTWRTGSAATQRWTIKGAGVFRRQVTVRGPDASQDLAVLRASLRGDGWVECATGSRFLWNATNSWRTQWGFYNAKGELLFVLKSKLSNPLRKQAVIETAAPSRELDELPLLLMLGWYLSVQSFYAGW